MPWEERKPGIVRRRAADGSSQQVADDVWFPNGMLILGDDTLVVAESHADDLPHGRSPTPADSRPACVGRPRTRIST